MAAQDERYSPTPYDEDSRGRSRSRSPVMRRSRSRSGSADGRREPRVITSKRLYISNIPYDMKWKDIKDLFKKNVGDCYVSLYETSDGKSRGAGIIEFRDVAKAQEAADKMHRYEINGRKIIVREETDRDRRRHQSDIRGEIGSGGPGLISNPPFAAMGGGVSSLMPNPQPGLMGSGSTGAALASLLANLPPNILQQLGITDAGQITNQVFIANLDYRVTWKKLKEVFSLAGNVVRAEVLQDPEGKSRGLAIVQFDTPVEALQAISMFNNQMLFDRTMTVKMDKMADSSHSRGPLPSGLKGIGSTLNLGPLAGNGNSGGNFSSSGSGAGLLGPGLMSSNLSGGLAGLAMNLNQGLLGDGASSYGNSGGYGNSGSYSNSGGYGNSSGYGGSNNYGNANSYGSPGGFGSSNSYGGGGNSGPNSGYGNGSYNSGSGGLGNLGESLASLAANLNSGDLSGLSNVISSLTGGAGLAGVGGGNLGPGGHGYGNRGGYGDGDGDGMRRDNRRISGSSSSNIMIPTVTNRNDECSSVFVRNLPFNFTWQMLKEIFKAAGDVQYAEIKKDRDQKSRGCGIVRFASGMEARRAISLLNNTKVNGRDIEVRLDSQFSQRNF